MNVKVNTILSYRLPTQIYVDGACRNNPGPLGCGLVVSLCCSNSYKLHLFVQT